MSDTRLGGLPGSLPDPRKTAESPGRTSTWRPPALPAVRSGASDLTRA